MNTRALLEIIDSIHFLVKHRDQHEVATGTRVARERMEIYQLLHFLSKCSTDFKSHLQTSPKNARCLSPTIQNEFIRINGDLIRQSVVKECNASPFWSVMADEATNNINSVCVLIFERNAWENLRFAKNFSGFDLFLQQVRSHLQSQSFQVLVEWIWCRLIGKGFDGASNMNGHVSRVSARLKELQMPGI